MAQAVQHIDHIAIVVYPENLSNYVEKISRLLGVTFDPPIRSEDAGVIAALSWDSGLELVAPLRQEGRYWKKLEKFGEGSTVIIFGVKDIDASVARVKESGIQTREWKFSRDIPWLSRFKLFREVKLEAFDENFATELTLSQIEPRSEQDKDGVESECMLVDEVEL
jgi:hypothetical protein